MVFDQIEQLKRQYTDQYVVVDEQRPELARFRGVTGQVKTINMNGRALVEFQEYIANIGWYDIELDFLKIVPKPDPAAAAAKPAKPVKAATAKAAVAKTPVPKAAAAIASASTEAKPAAAKPATAAKPAGKMSTADILAASRAKKAAESPAAAQSPAAASPAADLPAVEHAAPETAGSDATVAVAPKPSAAVAKPVAKPAAAAGAAGKSSTEKPTTTAEIIALCRRIDAKQ